MKKSKLDQYRDFIVEKLKSNVSISQICSDLKNVGCSISRSALTEWIDETAAAEGIVLAPRKRGRPANSKLAPFSFLPPTGEDPQSACPPLFLFGLQEGVSRDNNIGFCKLTLSMLCLPSANAHPDQWENLDQYADLPDLELLLLALRDGHHSGTILL